jgi:hypothetical protein
MCPVRNVTYVSGRSEFLINFDCSPNFLHLTTSLPTIRFEMSASLALVDVALAA